jgi:mRNA-degrading endonuclease RelE of RelBE toxin-antitoxin system
MRYTVTIDPQALEDLDALRVSDRRKIVASIEDLLATNPEQISKSRIKRLRGLDSPQFRLRVNGFRVFYDVHGQEVYVLRVLAKEDVEQYLKEMGHETGSGEH